MAGGKSGIYLHRSTAMDIQLSLPKGAKTNVERLAIILEQFMWLCNSKPLRQETQTRADWVFAFPWLSKIKIRDAFNELVFLGYLEARPNQVDGGHQGTTYIATQRSIDLFPSDSHPAPAVGGSVDAPSTLGASSFDPSVDAPSGSAPDTLSSLKKKKRTDSDLPKYTPEELSLAEDFILRTKNYLIGEKGKTWIKELSPATLASGMHKSELSLGELEAAFDYMLDNQWTWNIVLNHWALKGAKWREIFNKIP